MKHTLRSLSLALLLLGSVATADTSVTVDRDKLRENETFNLEFRHAGDLKGDPNFNVLATDFEILGRTSGRSMTADTSGTATIEFTWQFKLAPKRAGTLVIPAIAFGDTSSEPVTLEVLPAEKTALMTDDLLLEVELDRDYVYVQAQLVFTVRLLYTARLSEARLSEPEAPDSDIAVQPLDDGRRFETRRGGRVVEVFERRYAIFPQRSGTLRFNPIRFDGNVRESGWRNRPRQLESAALEVEVRGVPADYRGDWLPAADLAVIEEWPNDAPQFELGAPVTRTLVLRVQGQSGEQLPTLEQDLPDGLRQYADQPVIENQRRSTGVIGMRQEKLAIVPNRAGHFELPAIEVPWWDTTTGEARVARIPSREITVLPATTRVTQNAVAADSIVAGQQPAAAEVVNGAGSWASTALAATLGIGWLTTALAWWWTRRPSAPANAGSQTQGERRLRRQLRDACQCSDPDAARIALLALAKARWGRAAATNLQTLGSYVDAEMGRELASLSRALYADSRPTSQWDGAALWRAFEALQDAPAARASGASLELAGL